MGEIITLDKQKEEQCLAEVNMVLRKYGMALKPEVTLSTNGISFKLTVISTQADLNNSGKNGR